MTRGAPGARRAVRRSGLPGEVDGHVTLGVRRTDDMVVTDHEFVVPLDHDRPQGPTLTLFARELATPGEHDRPHLLFLPGGPGVEAPRPIGVKGISWLKRALASYRVLLLDYRGTGRSTPVTSESLAGATAEQQADLLKHLRADAIVRDAESIRRALGVPDWAVLGQSFGGFCAITYLSMFPGSLREVFIAGGLPPLSEHADDVYRATFGRLRQKLDAYFAAFPADRDRIETIASQLEREVVRIPSGARFTARRFRQLGHLLGVSDGFERLHYTLELPWGSPASFDGVLRAERPFERNPLHAVIHEACYADDSATCWSAERVQPEGLELSAEHVFSWMFEELPGLRPFAGAAEILAEYRWPPLYDKERLRKNMVPTAAVIYANDLFVERTFSEAAARMVGGARTWVTDEYEHDGLIVDGDRVFEKLMSLARGSRETSSSSS